MLFRILSRDNPRKPWELLTLHDGTEEMAMASAAATEAQERMLGNTRFKCRVERENEK